MDYPKPRFDAVYRDAAGSETIEIQTLSSGFLRTTIRGVDFEGADLDSFSVRGQTLLAPPTPPTRPSEMQRAKTSARAS